MNRNLLLCFVLCGAAAFGQSGTTVFNFLNIPMAPKQAALGGNTVSVRDNDVNMSADNPSLMNADMDNMIAVNYASYLADSKIGSLNYVRDLSEGHLVSLNVRYLDYGSMPRADENGNVSGNFGAMDASLGVGYAYQFSDDWTVGAGINLITSKIDTYSAMAVSGNFAVSYHRNDRWRKENLSLVFRNFGYEFKTYNGVQERMPFDIDLGYTTILQNFPLAVTVNAHDLQQLNISSSENNNGQPVRWTRIVMDHLTFGAELFPEDAFNIRLGYNVKRGNELAVQDQRNFSGLSAGFGVRISWLKFDYAHVLYSKASNVDLFGLTLDLDRISGISR